MSAIGTIQNEDEGPKAGQQVIDVILPTYIMKPAENEMFYPSEITRISNEVLEKYLSGKDYDEDACKEWVVTICDEIKTRVKEECHMPRFKLVCQATLGQMKDQGVRVASRCLWDTSVDNYASINYKNGKLWCSVIVFGCYCE